MDETTVVSAEELPEDAAEQSETTEQSEDTAEQSETTERSEDTAEQSDARLIKMSLDSGITPFETRYSQINSCYRKLPTAYRSFTYINSVMEGVIPPEKYSFAADETETGERLSEFNLKNAMKAVEQFILAGRKIEFVTARVSPRMVNTEDFYGTVKTVFDRYDFKFPDKICLEFPRTVLFEEEEKVRMALLSMKLLKVKTMIAGCGEKDSPVSPLLNLPFDYYLVSPFLTTLADNRDKGTAVSAFLAFLKSMSGNPIADGVYNDEQITALSRADCFGYIPSSGYQGSVSHGRLRMTLEEAVAQKEEEEF